jgi:hypothetical protein
VQKSETVPLLRFATQKKERLYEADRRASLAFSGRALAPLPHPPRASTKAKAAYLRWGWVWPLSLKLELC